MKEARTGRNSGNSVDKSKNPKKTTYEETEKGKQVPRAALPGLGTSPPVLSHPKNAPGSGSGSVKIQILSFNFI